MILFDIITRFIKVWKRVYSAELLRLEKKRYEKIKDLKKLASMSEEFDETKCLLYAKKLAKKFEENQ